MAHAAQRSKEEVCGLLFGEDGRITHAEPAENVAELRETSFEIDPEALFAAIRTERAGGLMLLGHYHSHPNGSPRPSFRDTAMALDTGRFWLIVSGSEITAWRATAPGRLDPVELALASEDDASQ